MTRKQKIARHASKHKRENQKTYAHEEISTATMKRCWIDLKTFILIPSDANDETERRKYLDNRKHYSSIYDTGKLGRFKKE